MLYFYQTTVQLRKSYAFRMLDVRTSDDRVFENAEIDVSNIINAGYSLRVTRSRQSQLVTANQHTVEILAVSGETVTAEWRAGGRRYMESHEALIGCTAESFPIVSLAFD